MCTGACGRGWRIKSWRLLAIAARCLVLVRRRQPPPKRCAQRARLREWRRSGLSLDEVLSVLRPERKRAALWSCPAAGAGAERSPEELLDVVDGGVDVAPVEARPCVGVE